MIDATQVGLAVLANLEAERDRKRAEAELFREQIRAIADRDVGPEWGRARRIRQRLPISQRPSLRTVQRHLQTIRATESSRRE